MIEKVKERWRKCTVAEKILCVAAPFLLIVIVVAETLLIFEVLATDALRAASKIALSIGWALVGSGWWKKHKHKLFSMCCFGLALGNFGLAVLLLLR